MGMCTTKVAAREPPVVCEDEDTHFPPQEDCFITPEQNAEMKRRKAALFLRGLDYQDGTYAFTHDLLYRTISNVKNSVANDADTQVMLNCAGPTGTLSKPVLEEQPALQADDRVVCEGSEVDRGQATDSCTKDAEPATGTPQSRSNGVSEGLQPVPSALPHSGPDTEASYDADKEAKLLTTAYFREVSSSLRYFRSCQPGRIQGILDSIVCACESFEGSLEFSAEQGVTPADIDTVSKLLTYDYPDIWWTRIVSYECLGDNVSKVLFKDFTKNSILEDLENIDRIVAEFLQSIIPNSGDFTKECAVHDFIVQYCDYNQSFQKHFDEDNYNINGFFKSKTGVCECYADVFLFLCMKLGLHALKITGHSANDTNGVLSVRTAGAAGAKGAGHAWNMILLDSAWYHVDTTWDDPVFASNAEKPRRDFISHIYLNLSDDYIHRDHVPDSEMPYPVATSMDQNYFVVNGGFISGDLSPEQLIAFGGNAAIKALTKGCMRCEFLCDLRSDVVALQSSFKAHTVAILYHVRQNSQCGVSLTSAAYSVGSNGFPSLTIIFTPDNSIEVCTSPVGNFGSSGQTILERAIAEAVRGKKDKVLFTFDATQPFAKSEKDFGAIAFDVLGAAMSASLGVFSSQSYSYQACPATKGFCLYLKSD